MWIIDLKTEVTTQSSKDTLFSESIRNVVITTLDRDSRV